MKTITLKIHPLVAFVAVAAMLMGTAAAATITTRTIQASYRNIKVVVDGAEVPLKDGAGNSVEPFISNGTTYLPLRVIGEALGKEVSWDGEANIVYVGDAAHLPYQVNKAELYDGKDPAKVFSIAGKDHKLGVVFQSFHSTDSGNEGQVGHDGSAIWNTEGFQTMTFTIGHEGSLQQNATLYISLDGIAAGDYQVRWDGSPQTITVPLGGSPNVKLTLVADPIDFHIPFGDAYKKYLASYGVYDVKLDK